MQDKCSVVWDDAMQYVANAICSESWNLTSGNLASSLGRSYCETRQVTTGHLTPHLGLNNK
ncbi:hypothetical protein HAX54_051075, partial [Datura stramonium]|nr:hypothetical protein [Datura stramonium]